MQSRGRLPSKKKPNLQKQRAQRPLGLTPAQYNTYKHTSHGGLQTSSCTNHHRDNFQPSTLFSSPAPVVPVNLVILPTPRGKSATQRLCLVLESSRPTDIWRRKIHPASQALNFVNALPRQQRNLRSFRPSDHSPIQKKSDDNKVALLPKFSESYLDPERFVSWIAEDRVLPRRLAARRRSISTVSTLSFGPSLHRLDLH